MKSIACLASFLLLLAGSAFSQDSTPPRGELRVMSFNVRLPAESDGDDYWETRKPLVVRMLREEQPDIIGMQELMKEQAEYVVDQLPGYAWLGRGRNADGSGEHMGVFYRKAAFRVIESGDFWLSDTPSVPGSITWGHPHPRMVTWVLFERRADGTRFRVLNTHLPYRDGDEAARTRGAQAIVRKLASWPVPVPVIVTGDFNTGPDSQAHAELSRIMQDAWTAAERVEGVAATFHAFHGAADRRIDWIFVRGMQVDSVATVTTRWRARYPSDHFPVVAVLRLP